MSIEKTYEPQKIESDIYKSWEQKGFFKPKGQGESYCIMLPPPNVTGSLHMGHGFQHTLMDILTRYHRMSQDDALWQPGVDHAGIATQMVVERQLGEQNKTRHDLGREDFIKKVWEWKEQSGGNITRQMRRLGSSPDWSKERFTMDDGLSHATKTAFIKLYEEGLIYRAKRLVNWDPVLHTAVSDLEVISKEEQGHLWHFRYPLTDGSGYLTIATTRPETLLGDTAVAVHPEDERYQHLIGKTVSLPLCDRAIPIIADDYVDPEFGTGCVKITPAHDFNDHEVGKRHDLPMINIFTPDAKINSNGPKIYHGLDRYKARVQIVADLDKLGLLEKIDKHTLKVPRNDRGGAVIEPYLTNQWYVKVESLAKPAIEAVESGKVKFIPDNWKNTYFAWMRDIQDWCISRQLWWGHRIPVWYDDKGNHYAGFDEADARRRYKLSDDILLEQDNDVLDTWFSSGLWPFSTLGWPEKTPDLQKFYPTNVLVTGFDIIFFWVARMMMFGLKFIDDVPFTEIYITGLIRDSQGQKMSKSKGNVLDPVDLIDGISLEDLIQKRTHGLMLGSQKEKVEKSTKKEFPEGINAYGTDALRFTFCALASTSRDINFDIHRMEGYRNFCNKLWNASRFVFMQIEKQAIDIDQGEKTLSPVDLWIWAKLNDVVSKAHQYIKQYRFDLLAQAIYEFIWNEYCDWYLELSKVILNDKSSSVELRRGTCYTLIHVLETALRLAHPIIPFITESIWQKLGEFALLKGDSIMMQAYPMVDLSLENPAIIEDIDWVKEIIVKLRTVRSEMNLKPSLGIPLLCQEGSDADHNRLETFKGFIQSLCKIESIDKLAKDDTPPASASTYVGDLACHIPMAGLIDMDAEKARLNKEIEKLQKDIKRLEIKLGNEKFTANAPREIVAKEQAKLEEAKQGEARFLSQLTKLSLS